MVQKQGLAPKILEQVVLFEVRVVHDEEVEVTALPILEDGFCLRAVGIVQVVQVHKALRLVPTLKPFLLFHLRGIVLNFFVLLPSN